ncbi:MAG: thiamine-phosphate synthase family protein [Candidatus Poseidoniaceae archaeon]
MLGIIGDKWLERLHQHVAKDLRTKGWSQTEIAEIMGSTQSTISRQMQKSPRQLGATADEATIDSWGNELSQALASMGPGTNVLRQRLIVELQFTGNHTLRFDKTLTGTDLDAGQEQRALLRRLEWAASRLDVKRIGDAIPAVGLNIASCTHGAFAPEEVAAFPGRITLVDGALRHHETPAFGTSKHLAGLLLAVHEQDEGKVSALNIKPPLTDDGVDIERIKQACEQLGYTFGLAPKGKLSGRKPKHDVLLDEGAFGWEPSLYILAHNPLELVDRTHQIAGVLSGVSA